MRFEKPSSWKIIITSSMLPVWIFGGVFSLGVIFLLVFLWIEAQFVLEQEVLGVSFLLFLALYYSLSRFRLPTIEAIFDIHVSNFRLEKNWLWIHRTEEYPLSDIKYIHVIQKGRFGKAKLYYRIEVELISGMVVFLSAGNYRAKEHLEMIAKKLRELLD